LTHHIILVLQEVNRTVNDGVSLNPVKIPVVSLGKKLDPG